MSGFDNLKTAITAAQASYDAKRETLERLKSEIAIDLARLDGMKASLDIIEKSELGKAGFNPASKSEKPLVEPERQQRFRLGTKKRTVFQLVKDFAASLREIEAAVQGYDIDSRYIRDVIRKAIDKNHMVGDVEGTFEITQNGIEMLEKAPLPKEWDNFKGIFEEQKAPHALASEASNFTGEVEVIVSPDASPLMSLERLAGGGFNQGSD